MVQYQSGGLAEKELILRQLETPAECTTIADALQGPCRHRATDLSVKFRSQGFVVPSLFSTIKATS